MSQLRTYFERQSGEDNIAEVLRIKDTSKFIAAWVVSNCNSTEGAKLRLEYVVDMVDAGLRLDGYGECFDKILADQPWTRVTKSNFKWGRFSRYKFYLAFENSIHCPDYMSEKVWRNSLLQGLVPVIYGPHRDDVRAMLPEKSYIHVEDFNSPEEVVKYLNYLDGNDTAYAQYHQWRKLKLDLSKPIRRGGQTMNCGICEEVSRRKAAGFPKKMISSVANWWWVNVHDEHCTKGSNIPGWLKNMEKVSLTNQYDEGMSSRS